MESKRNRDEEDHQNNDDNNLQIPAKRRRCDTDNHSLLTVLEPLFRKLVEELIPPMLQRYVSPCCRLSHNHQGGSSGVRPLQLCFLNELPQTIFTMGNLTAEDDGPLKIELRNAASQQRVEAGEVSTMKARIYVLDGDFGNEEWTAEEFRAAIVKPRPLKGPLLRGETVIKLVKGIGFINNKFLVFTDNSSTTRSKKYRLGVQIEESNSLGAGIREAISEPFRVKDNRVESIKKHDRPSLDDNVWRLKHIGRGGRLHRQLSDNGIKTVKDLLRFNTTGLLQEKFSKINALDRIIAHAKDSELDDNERYFYTYHAMEQLLSVSLVFNCIYEVVEVIFNGQQPRSLESLNSEEKGLVERIKRKAYQNLQNVKPIETQTHDIVKKLIDIQEASYRASDQVQLETLPSTSTSIMDDSNLNLSFGEQVVPREAGINIIDGGNEWIPNVTDIEEFEGLFESYFDPKPNPSPYQWDQHDFSHFAAVDDGASCSNGFFSPDSAGCMTNKRKTKTVWQKIRNALKVLSPYLAKRKRPILFCGQN